MSVTASARAHRLRRPPLRRDTHRMGDSHPRSSGRPSGEPSGGGTWRQYVKSGVLLLVGGVSRYLVLRTLVSVFSSWRSLLPLDWGFAVLVFACEAASYVWLWQLDRIALATRGWFPLAPPQLSGAAVRPVVA